MKILKLLNKLFLSILVTFFTLFGITYSEEQPVDIWNIDKSKLDQNNVNDNDKPNEITKDENSNQILTKVKNNNKIDKNILFNNFKIFIWYYFFNYFIRCWKINPIQ